MQLRKHTIPLALGLCVLFLFTLVPGGLLHDHEHDHDEGIAHHENADHQELEGVCGICDMVLPIRLELATVYFGPLDPVIQVRPIAPVSALLEGSRIFCADRGPPQAIAA